MSQRITEEDLKLTVEHNLLTFEIVLSIQVLEVHGIALLRYLYPLLHVVQLTRCLRY